MNIQRAGLRLELAKQYHNKIFKGNGDERDPYLVLQSYLSHRPEGNDMFYLYPIGNQKTYKTLALKRDGQGNFMKSIPENAGIQNEGNFTNSSGRKTAIQSLRSHFDPLTISKLTGHANPNSIQSYSHNSLTERGIFNRLTGYNTTTACRTSFSTAHQPYSHVRENGYDVSRIALNLLSNSTLNNCKINMSD